MKSNSAFTACALLLSAVLTAACATSRQTRPESQLARAEASVQQADQSGARQYSPVEFDAARDKLGEAHRLADKGDGNRAGMLADQARADAEFAAAHARHQTADKAATEVRLATETLQEEAQRQQPSPAPSTP